MFSRYNYNAPAGSSQAHILSDIVSVLCGQGNTANLTGKVILSSQVLTYTSGSTTVTWAGANNGLDGVDANRQTLAVGQVVCGNGIPSGTTIATITNGTGYTLSAAPTASGTVMGFMPTSTLPAYTAGATQYAMSTATTTTQTITSHAVSAISITAGAKISSTTLPVNTTVSSVNGTSGVVTNNAALSTSTSATFVISTATALADTTNSFIYDSIYAAGWQPWDSSAGTLGYNTTRTGISSRCLRAPLADNPNAYKYMILDAATSGYLSVYMYESWNNAAHSGTNGTTIAQIPSATHQRLTYGVAASVLMFASARCAILLSTVAAGVGSSVGGYWSGVLERSRLASWDTVAAGYPPVVQQTQLSFYVPRVANPTGGDLAVQLASLKVPTSNMILVKIPDGLGGFNTPFNDVSVAIGGATGFPGGSVSSICDVWFSVDYPATLDEVVKSGVTYVFLQNQSSTGSGKLVVPKG